MSPPLDWTPRKYNKDGARFCSEACGNDCMLLDHAEATKQARDLARRLGNGWKPVVMENHGWYWHVAKGPAELRRIASRKYWLSVIIRGQQYQRDGVTPFEAIGKVWLDLRVAANALEHVAQDLRPVERGKRRK